MPDLFSMKRPLAVNYASGDKTVMVAYYPHADGLVFLPPFWEQREEGNKAVLIKGEITGNGPWKIADAVISLVGCQGTDSELAQMLAEWEFHVQSLPQEYFQPEDIRRLAREYGAII
ncbi:MAG: hypothetical protein OEY29_08645 [Gammaproteobacteria bacterium]|nr:hypothetical protein [Gammaproteobacteria bacterium]